jgi:2,4-dienoyl-CoA reductase (NADPH2)
MVSMARPFLADADFVNKAAAGRADDINTCIACNQACLDHTFSNRWPAAWSTRAPATRPSCDPPRPARQRFAVVGAGPAGLAAATTLAERGHEVHLFDGGGASAASSTWRAAFPARRSSSETLRYFARRSRATGVRCTWAHGPGAAPTGWRGLRRRAAGHRRAARATRRSPARTTPRC